MCTKQSSHIPAVQGHNKAAGFQTTWAPPRWGGSLFATERSESSKLTRIQCFVECCVFIYWSTSLNVLVWGSVCVYGCFSASTNETSLLYWCLSVTLPGSFEPMCQSIILAPPLTAMPWHSFAPLQVLPTPPLPPISPSCLRGLPVRHDSHSHWNEAATSRPVV